MKIEHIAIWTQDLEKMKTFYLKFFELECGEKYENKRKQFSSYFLSFESGARIELMHIPDLLKKADNVSGKIGFSHFAISVGSKEIVDQLTERIRNGGYDIIGEPRTTGDGYYESVIADPEGNLVEITE
jgi:lactoylglutathione lyase